MGSYFLTALYGYFSDEEEGISFTFARGGHCPPILCGSGGESAALVRTRGKPLGIFEGIAIEERTVSLYPGDRIFLYTDGLHEAVNAGREMLGYEGLLEIVERHRKLPLSESMDGIIESADLFRDQAASEDDVVLLGFEYSGKKD
jgi:sigma-B regulation protein RsbU (phosphoserine phosphatase)